MPYQFATYNFQDAGRSANAHEGMHKLEAEGWEIVAATPTFTEMSVLWRKPHAAELEEITAQAGEVHCDGCQCKTADQEPAPDDPVTEE